MQITCPFTFPGQPELDAGDTLWAFIAGADHLTCVQDGDAIQVACRYQGREVPLFEVAQSLWRCRGALGEVVAQRAARSGCQYRHRLQVFRQKEIRWLD